MKIAFKKTHKYCCDNCGKQFDWQDGKSIAYGKSEYKTVHERRTTEKTFCSEACYYEFDCHTPQDVLNRLKSLANE